jgi:hypothetical protein
MKRYPDVTEIMKQKSQHRRSMAALPFERKIEIVLTLQERRRFIKSGQIVRNRTNAPSRKKNGD